MELLAWKTSVSLTSLYVKFKTDILQAINLKMLLKLANLGMMEQALILALKRAREDSLGPTWVTE